MLLTPHPHPQVVIVNQSVQRVFGQEQWAQLDRKLSTWHQNIGNILEAINLQQAQMNRM
jgi:hypothetical protein